MKIFINESGILRLSLALICLSLFTTTNAATITSGGDGNFNDPGTWVGEVLPTAADDVIIDSDHSVDVTANDTVGSITVYSNFDGDFTRFTINSGVTLTVNGNVHIQSDASDELDEPNSHIRLPGTLIIGGNLIFSTLTNTDPSFAILKMTYAGGTLELKGDMNFLGEGGVIDARDNRETTLKFTGSSAQVIPVNTDVEYYNIIIDNGSSEGVSLGGNINSANVFGDITIENGKFQNSGNSITGVGGFNFTVKDGTSYILSGTTSLPVNFNHVIETGATILYAGSNQSVSTPNNSQDYHHLTISGSGTKTLTSNITINGDLTLSSSTLDADEFNNYDIEIKGDLTKTGGNFEAREGTVTFSGPSPTLTGTTTFSGVLAIPSGTTLNTGGNLILASGASLMHGAGTPGGGGNINGSVTVQRTGNSDNLSNNFWSSPVSAANVNILGNDFYYYDPSSATDLTTAGMQNGWVTASGNMTPGLGYTAKGGGTVGFSGTVNNAPTGTPITVDIMKNVGTSNDVPYNLIGNPFPSALDAGAFMDVNGPTGNNIIAGALYFWDDDGTGGSGYSTGDFGVWTGAGSIIGPNSGTSFDGYIGSGQSFFVEKNDDGTSQVEFRNSMRSTTNNAFFKKLPIERLWISLTNNANDYNETLIAFIEDATDSSDILYDARKLLGSQRIALYTKIHDEAYAIQALPNLTADKTVALGINAESNGVYTLNLKSIENLDETVVVILEDTELGVFQNLRSDSSYTFQLNHGTDIDRFLLHFNPEIKIDVTGQDCEGNNGAISVSQNSSYHWDYVVKDNNGSTLVSGNDLNSINDITDLVEGDYTLHLTDSFDYQVVKQIPVEAKDVVTAKFDIIQTTVNSSTQLQFINQSTGATEYFWDFGDGTQTNTEHPQHTLIPDNSYNILLRASNADCIDEYHKTIDLSTDIPSINPSLNLTIYTDNMNIYISFNDSKQQDAMVTLYNILGQELLRKNISTNGTHTLSPVDHSNFYLVKIDANGTSIEKKVFLP